MCIIRWGSVCLWVLWNTSGALFFLPRRYAYAYALGWNTVTCSPTHRLKITHTPHFHFPCTPLFSPTRPSEVTSWSFISKLRVKRYKYTELHLPNVCLLMCLFVLPLVADVVVALLLFMTNHTRTVVNTTHTPAHKPTNIQAFNQLIAENSLTCS